MTGGRVLAAALFLAAARLCQESGGRPPQPLIDALSGTRTAP